MRDFVAPGFALADATAEPLKSLQKERLDVVRLQAARFGALHVLPDTVDPARVHGVVGKGTLFQEILESATVEGACDDLREPCTHFSSP